MHDNDVSDELIQPFFQIMQSMDNIYEEYARKNNLTYMSMYILETIYDLKKCTQKEISQITLYPKQTVNMVIRSFIKKEWVCLEQTDGDKRSKYVRLTDLGEKCAKKIIRPFWDAGNCAFAELDEEKREIMLGVFSSFTRSFIKKVKSI